MTSPTRELAPVLGGGMAGLFAARVLAEAYDLRHRAGPPVGAARLERAR
jgi:hypothetical protein